ncbi:caspase family protein [Caballeronia sp. EK]|uniref:hypothetical protein n=1 Tax=Caballeronia sp. EK TaxID=2767469 RepID=UPI0019CE2FF4|nr:hypothetical protein [Caballeronia sp. EK]MBC8642915.1 caspase family protein [Caballeronia sp. EK]
MFYSPAEWDLRPSAGKDKPPPSAVVETPTAAILLGASAYPQHKEFGETKSFLNSKEAIKLYLRDTLKVSCILDLFNAPEPASVLLTQMSAFLKMDVHARFGSLASVNLIVYYIGHGYPASSDPTDYYLALSSTTDDHPEFTSLEFRLLARLLRTEASEMRKFVILDSCFAGMAFIHMGNSRANAQKALSDRTKALLTTREVQVKSVPTKGTALYCAADRDVEALVPREDQYTMFSGALLHALKAGRPRARQYMSMADIHEVVWEHLEQRFRKEAVRPALHAPDQSGGDIARNVLLFPNPQWREGTVDEFTDEIPVQRTAGDKSALAIAIAAVAVFLQLSRVLAPTETEMSKDCDTAC